MGERLFRLFRELNKRLNTTVLIATHDMALVRRANADVLRLADGMVVRAQAPPCPPAGHAGMSRHLAPLLPREDAREAALFFVVCALCFLAAFSGLVARAAYAAADAWTSEVTGQITIRVRGSDADTTRAVAIVQATPGVASARALDRADAEELLQPWLGAGGIPADLPLPHLIAAEAAPGATGVGDRLTAALQQAATRRRQSTITSSGRPMRAAPPTRSASSRSPPSACSARPASPSSPSPPTPRCSRAATSSNCSTSPAPRTVSSPACSSAAS